jgi:Methyltransferase domain
VKTAEVEASGPSSRSVAGAIPEQNQRTIARLHRIGALNGARRYLEIGVFKGKTFLNQTFAHSDGVDPNFQFDPAPHGSASRRFFKMSSDEFFLNRPEADPYDLIFLDGLHTFEQTFRDICASMAMSHPGTVWVIDDTMPSDIFSAITNQREALRLRAAHGKRSNDWHGDVFKAVFALHDFFPTFDYRTVTDDGNPQTVMIRRPRPDFNPKWNSLEAISRLGYQDFLANKALLQPCGNIEMLGWLASAGLPRRA